MLMHRIVPGKNEAALTLAATTLRQARKVVALTGAGISVASGIPDFRSPDGLWHVFAPEEYATLEVFHRNPAKAWDLYRALGKTLVDKKPNAGHYALAELGQAGLLAGIITQNVDNLHQQAGSTPVFEIHGDHQHLHCLQCETVIPAHASQYLTQTGVPRCSRCGFPLKPNVVLFGEDVREIEAIQVFIADCDLLMVIGTSAQVYPAASLPAMVHRRGGSLFEFNREQVLSSSLGNNTGANDFFFQGDAHISLPLLARACCGRQS